MGRTEQCRDGPVLGQGGLNGIEGRRIVRVACIHSDGLSPSRRRCLSGLLVAYPHQDQPPLVQICQAQVFLDRARGTRLGRNDQYHSLGGADGLSYTFPFICLIHTRSTLFVPDHDVALCEVERKTDCEVGVGGSCREEDSQASDELNDWPSCH